MLPASQDHQIALFVSIATVTDHIKTAQVGALIQDDVWSCNKTPPTQMVSLIAVVMSITDTNDQTNQALAHTPTPTPHIISVGMSSDETLILDGHLMLYMKKGFTFNCAQTIGDVLHARYHCQQP
jgi:hypothetical protein